MADEQIDRLKRGGDDLVKIYAAYARTAAHVGQPSVILAHTKQGYGMGSAGQGKITTQSQKQLDEEALLEFRKRFNLPLSDTQMKDLDFFKPAEDSAEMKYLHARRAALGGYVPVRHTGGEPVEVPTALSWQSPITCAPSRSRCGHSFPATVSTPPWAPTALGAAIHAPRCARTSGSMPHRSWPGQSALHFDPCTYGANTATPSPSRSLVSTLPCTMHGAAADSGQWKARHQEAGA